MISNYVDGIILSPFNLIKLNGSCLFHSLLLRINFRWCGWCRSLNQNWRFNLDIPNKPPQNLSPFFLF